MRDYSAHLPVAGQSTPRRGRESLPVAAGEQQCVDKAIAYITRGDRFVVFEEPESPAAGTQIPGGTVEPGESLEAAVLREAYEETGLEHLRLVRALGVQLHRRPSGRIHRRHYFHLVDRSTSVQQVWEHYEEHPHSGAAPILYRLRWASLEKPPALHAELDGAFQQLRVGLTKPRCKPRRLGTEPRHAARALVFDSANRLLLLRVVVEGCQIWVTPGGGVESDETYTCAVSRELAEEVGVPVNLGPIVCIRRYDGSDGRNIGLTGEHMEVFFHARVNTAGYQPTRADDCVVGHKWWPLDELVGSRELFAPRGLPRLLPDLLDSAVHGRPVDTGL